MADRPILFSAPMVRALLDGRKTQTRRVLKDQPGDLDKPFMMDDGSWHVTDSRGGHMSPLPVRFAKGDRLWVREAFCNDPVQWHPGPTSLVHRADFRESADTKDIMQRHGARWRPGIHMPRWASRLTLAVTDVRVQRLQEIGETDAEAEGAYLDDSPCDHSRATCEEIGCLGQTYKAGFCNVWSLINGTPSWLANPWVVALTFSVTKGNINEVAEQGRPDAIQS